jgi:hypothetical protein
MDGLNKLFMRDPVAFMRRYAIQARLQGSRLSADGQGQALN